MAVGWCIWLESGVFWVLLHGFLETFQWQFIMVLHPYYYWKSVFLINLFSFFFVFASYNAPNVMFWCFNVKHVHLSNLRTRIQNDFKDHIFEKLTQHYYFFSLAIQHVSIKASLEKSFYVDGMQTVVFSLKLRTCFYY